MNNILRTNGQITISTELHHDIQNEIDLIKKEKLISINRKCELMDTYGTQTINLKLEWENCYDIKLFFIWYLNEFCWTLSSIVSLCLKW